MNSEERFQQLVLNDGFAAMRPSNFTNELELYIYIYTYGRLGSLDFEHGISDYGPYMWISTTNISGAVGNKCPIANVTSCPSR